MITHRCKADLKLMLITCYFSISEITIILFLCYYYILLIFRISSETLGKLFLEFLLG